MVRGSVHWFGTPSADIPVAVGADSPTCQQLHTQHAALVTQYQNIKVDLATIDWSDPQAARAEAAALSRQTDTVQQQIAGLEKRQIANGCAPG